MPNAPTGNQLLSESSPYLRQHAGNPVFWRPWSIKALEEACSLDRPILLSIGYAACHWCHVMAHESFEDPDVADVMNRLFVNIKVDREERPDIDQIYMAALTAMGERGGWPLTMFLTPDGGPFWGGTYFPKEARYGRPGFVQVLEAVARTWAHKRDDLARSATALSDHVRARLAPLSSSQALTADRFEAHAGAIAAAIDPIKGGLRGAPKFPNSPFLELLWLSWLNSGSAGNRDAVLLSLRHMLSGGIYDHVGGGLCRYSTDADWTVPHFEKMLYDNAQLISLCCHVYADTNDGLFRNRIEETVGWLQREMFLAGGGFASSLDADSEGEEGRFYVWTPDELASVLGRDTPAFLSRYELAKPSEWEGDPILRRITSAPEDHDTTAQLSRLRQLLLNHRASRPRPTRDDKALIDWNGITISALVAAGRLLGRSDWVELAIRTFRFVAESQREGRLPHSVLGEQALFPAMATDYAAMITAAVSLFQATGDRSYLSRARDWCACLDRWYVDDAGTGFYLTASDATDIPMRLRSDIDDALPSATAQIIVAFVRLAAATGDRQLADRAMTLAENAVGRAERQTYGQAGIHTAGELARNPLKLIIVDRVDGAFVAEANRWPDPRRVDVLIEPGQTGNSVTLADGTVIDTHRPGAWLCVGQSCLPPAFDEAATKKLLREWRGSGIH